MIDGETNMVGQRAGILCKLGRIAQGSKNINEGSVERRQGKAIGGLRA